MSTYGPSPIRVTVGGKEVTLSEKEVQQYDKARAYIKKNPAAKDQVAAKLGPKLRPRYNAYVAYRANEHYANAEKHHANVAQGSQELQELCQKRDAIGAELAQLRSEQDKLAIEIDTSNKAIINSRNKCNLEVMSQSESIPFKPEGNRIRTP